MATGSESIMWQRTTKVVDRAAVDVLVGRADGEAGFKRVDFQVTPRMAPDSTSMSECRAGLPSQSGSSSPRSG
jgi:hypothetical protein